MSRARIARGSAIWVQQHDHGRGAAGVCQVLGVHISEPKCGHNVTIATQPGADHGAHLGRVERGCEPHPRCLTDNHGEPAIWKYHDVKPASSGFGRVAGDAASAIEVEHGQNRDACRLDCVLDCRHELKAIVFCFVAHLRSSARSRPFGYLPTVTQVPFAMDFDATSGVLAVSGDLDEQPTVDLRRALEEHSEGYARGTVLDLSGVTYLPSTAVAVLARASQEFKSSGTTFELAAAAGSVAQRVLTVCAMPHRSY